MNNTITGILALVIIVLVGFLYYIENFKVPNLEQRIQDLKEAPVERDTVYAKGKTDTLWLAPPDSLFKPEAKKPLLVAEKDTLKPTKEYETEVSDSLLKGTIYNTVVGEGYLANAEFTYKFKKPLFTTQRIDTIYETETRTIMEFVPSPKPFRVQAGIMAGAVPSGDFYFGPSIGILNRKDDYFSYSYDILNKGHFISYKKTIRIRK